MRGSESPASIRLARKRNSRNRVGECPSCGEDLREAVEYAKKYAPYRRTVYCTGCGRRPSFKQLGVTM